MNWAASDGGQYKFTERFPCEQQMRRNWFSKGQVGSRSAVIARVVVPLLFAAVLATAAIGKAVSLEDFAAVVATLQFIPRPMRGVTVVAVPTVELCATVLLLLPETRRSAMRFAIALLSVFCAVLAWRLWHPAGKSCSCFGRVDLGVFRSGSDRFALARNFAMMSIGMCWLLLTKEPVVSVCHDDGAPASPRSHTDVPRTATAFSLVELIVVVGIIGILIGLLVPVVSRARASASAVHCRANLHEIANAAALWAGEHRGFLPLDGEVHVPAGTAGLGSLPGALRDSGKLRYSYTSDDGTAPTSTAPPTLESPTPFLVVMFLQMVRRASGGADVAPTANWSSVEGRFASSRVFHCPDANRAIYWAGSTYEGIYSSELIDGNVGYASPWYTTFDYATNTGLLGFHHDAAFAHRRYGGNASRIRRPSQMVVCGDSGGMGLNWIPELTSASTRVTLADVLRKTREISFSSVLSSSLSATRHKGSVDLAFADGHVEAVRIDDASLAQCELLQD